MESISSYNCKSDFIENMDIYQTLINSIAQAIWEADDKGVIINDSPSWRAYTGQTYEECVGNEWFNAIHLDDRAYVNRQWRKSIQELRSFNVECRVKDQNGKWKWTNIISSPIFDCTGNIKKWVGINIDISQRKKMEQKLYNAEELCRRILTTTNEGIAHIDNRGKISFVNEVLEKLLGYNQSEMVDKNIEGFFNENHVRKTSNNFEKSCNDIETYNLVYRKKDGILKWLQVNESQLLDSEGNYNGKLAIFSDITNRKDYEQKLIEKEKEYLEIVDSFTEGSIIRDLENNEAYLSNEWKKRLGIEHLSSKEAISIYDKNVHPDDIVRMNKTFQDALKRKESKVRIEFRVKTVDSGYIWILSQAKIIYNQKGKAIKYYGTYIDITELKQNEEKIKENEELYRKLFENTEYGFQIIKLIYDKNNKATDFRFIKVNDAYEKETGIKVTDILGKTASEVLPNIESYWIEMYDLVAKNRKIMTCENYGSSTGRWYSTLFFPYKKHQVGVLLKDITDHKNYEEKLAIQAKILSNVQEAIFVVDENDIISYCNKAHEKIFGWKEYELVGRQFYDYASKCIDSNSQKKITCKSSELALEFSSADEIKARDIGFFCKDGTHKYIDVNRACLRDPNGEYKGFISSARDVTERKTFEDSLSKSEEKYRNLFNLIDEGFCIIEIIFDKNNKPIDFKFIEINPNMRKKISLDNTKFEGRTAKDLKLEFKEFLHEILSKGVLKGNQVKFTYEMRKDERTYAVNAYKIGEQKDSYIAVLFQDISQEVNTKKFLEQSLKMQDEIYANVAHELKTPLNVIYSANQIMELFLNNGDLLKNKERISSYNYSVRQNCYRLTKLINNIVDVSKMKTGHLKLNLKNENIVAIVESIVQSISEYVKTSNLRIVFDTNTEEKIIACDSDKIERIILNLVSNAIKFSNPEDEIYVGIFDKGECVEISVKDTGIGIEKKHLDNLFQRFYQVDKSLSRNAEGSGIGLSLVKSFIDLHGGSISVDSEIGKGSTFRVELPSIELEDTIIEVREKPMNTKIEILNVEFSDIYSIN